MSCFVFSLVYINEIVNFANQMALPHVITPGSRDYDVQDQQDATALGQLLHVTNVASFRATYSDRIMAAHVFQFKRRAHPISALQCLKALDCLEYNSDTAPGWEHSPAREAINALRRIAIKNLPGYDDAWWELVDAVATETNFEEEIE